MQEGNERTFELWDITAEQADKIKAGDVEARNDFYFKNYDKLERIAKKFAAIHNAVIGRKVYDVDEMLAQLYIDLPFLYWNHGAYLLESIRHNSFTWSAFGGYAQRKIQGLSVKGCPWRFIQNNTRSLDETFTAYGAESEEVRLLDIVADEDTPETLLEKNMSREVSPDELAELFADLMGKRELEFLKLYLAGVQHCKIAERMGICTSGITNLKIEVHRKLVLNYETVLARLEQIGVSVPDCYKHKPADYEAMLKALEIKRAKYRDYVEKNREKLNAKKRQRRAEERAARAGGNA